MTRIIPGTTLELTEQARNAAFSIISPILEATGGLTLSQLSKLTGLNGTTIQNWIKRGWVSSTKGKKYDKQQLLRILLINMLRKSMKLVDIVDLMEYINGDVEDTSDDIVAEDLLFNILCRIIFKAEDEGAFIPEIVEKLVYEEVECYKDEIVDTDRLKKAMYVMIMAYRCGCLMDELNNGMEVIKDEMQKA